MTRSLIVKYMTQRSKTSKLLHINDLYNFFVTLNQHFMKTFFKGMIPGPKGADRLKHLERQLLIKGGEGAKQDLIPLSSNGSLVKKI